MSWRSDPEYLVAKQQALERFKIGHGQYRCAWCGNPFFDSEITPSHLLSVGAHPKLKMCAANLVAMCVLCHNDYEALTEKQQRDLISYYHWASITDLLAIEQARTP